MEETTRLENDHFELEGEIWASSVMGALHLLQGEPFLDETGALKLSPRAQYDLLKWLYERRYPLYMATTLSLGDNAPAWIASGKPGNVTTVVDANEYHDPEQRFTGQLLHESGEVPLLFLETDLELP
jgi:hypothetical protein